jgi:poly-gamma-glutamate synthase PgsB/CapB
VTVLLATLSLFLSYLVYEKIALNRLRKSIPLVITVTGTRGKTSTVRLLASVLREAGRRVLAKTTGSQAQFLLPDGTTQDIARRGVVTILEQKKTLRKAAQLNADCIIVEMMSIRPENHRVEAGQILKPDIALLTNVRRDHTDAMGDTLEDIARTLRLGLPLGAKVYIPEEYRHLVDSSTQRSRPLQIMQVGRQTSSSLKHQDAKLSNWEFAENLDLVTAVAMSLNIGEATIIKGMRNVAHDIGKFSIWTYRMKDKKIVLVGAFAANDPESTMRVYEKTREALGEKPTSFTGLLNLRTDRPDRTVQWIGALNGEMADLFKKIYVVGGHAAVLRRKVSKARLLSLSTPEEMMKVVGSTMENSEVLFGFGNIGGIGRELVEHWRQAGEAYGI